MTFEKIARRYLRELQDLYRSAIASSAATPELSYRPALDGFFRDIAGTIPDRIVVVHEPSKQSEAGHPDWRFHNADSLGVYGYVEAKGLSVGEAITPAKYSGQVEKYLRLGHRVILSDGIDFVFSSPSNASPRFYSLIDKPIPKADWSTLTVNPLLETQFHEFFRKPGYRRVSEEQLVKEVAQRAKELARSVVDLVGLSVEAALDEEERKTIIALNELKELVENHHDPSLRTPKAFADFVAQVLAFGPLYAHRFVRAAELSPRERYEKLVEFWTNTVYSEHAEPLRPFRALLDILKDELNSLGPLGTWYQDSLLLLAHIRLEKEQVESPDFHRLYEQFLSIFDPETRFDYGAFYTPRPLAEFTTRLVLAVAASEYGDQSLYNSDNKLIDPCSGTGTFLEQLILHGEGRFDLPEIIGFEILPAPYALAHYRMSLLSNNAGALENVSVILTNTLSDELEREMKLGGSMNLIKVEQYKARQLSRPPLMLIIGNPPSSDSPKDPFSSRSEGDNFTIIHKLLEDFRPPPGQRTGRQNIQKQIKNEFMKFLRWAGAKLIRSKPGILALILPSTFAEHPTYRYARQWLFSHFPKFWVLDFDKDARTGVRASNLFPTLQGRLLLIAITGLDQVESHRTQVYYASIADLSKQGKIAELERERKNDDYLAMFEAIDYSDETYNLRPQPQYDEKLYSRFWHLHPEKERPVAGEAYVFERSVSSVKLAPTHLFVHVDRDVLLRRTRDVANESIPVDELIKRWFAGQRKPPPVKKFTPAVRKLIREAVSRAAPPIRTYAYRPFLFPKVLLSEPVLSHLGGVGGGGTRYRPEVLAAFDSDDTIGIAVAPAPRDIGPRLHRFASFCWHLPDNDLVARGNAYVFCNQFPEYKRRRGDWDPTPHLNTHSELTKKVAAMIGADDENDASKSIVFYVYAVLCSDAFLDAFHGALYTVADPKKRPRIPFTSDVDLFHTIVEKGKDLAMLENPDATVELPDDIASLTGLFPGSFRLLSYSLDEDTGTIELNNNHDTVVSLHPISKEVTGFEVSGYKVLDQWLKLHSWIYSRREFREKDYLKFLRLIARLRRQIDIVAELDNDISKLVSGEAPLLEPA